MAKKPSVSFPDDMLDTIDDRRHSRTDRSEWIQQASIVRLLLEDTGEWEDTLDQAEEMWVAEA